MKAKTILVVVAMAAVAVIIIANVATRRAPAAMPAAMPAAVARASDTNSKPIALPFNPVVEAETGHAATPMNSKDNGVKPAAAQADPALVINGYVVEDPMARVALHFVGADPEADAYWIGAINDSSLPAEERKDLIEDLNEDGLSDPHHPSAQDMPLIAARLRLIEQLIPTAMDDVNQAAFTEAYNDLTDLLNGKEPK